MYDKTKTKLVDRRELLRIKVKSLAAEAHIIRREEARSFGQLEQEMRKHRIFHLRRISRLSNLAYGIIRGRTMSEMEGKVNERNKLTTADMKEITAMISKYGPVNGGQVIASEPTPARAARQARGIERAKLQKAKRDEQRKSAKELHAVPA